MKSRTLQSIESTHNQHFDYILVGKQNVDIRQTIIHELTGEKPTKAKSGITVIRDLLKSFYSDKLSVSCWATNEKELSEIISGWRF
tara:strand:+ start:253 stop:510 length:258 start_codon:yes stop_codon:yes gene_type:complete